MLGQLEYPPIQQMQPVATYLVESWFLVGGAFAQPIAPASTCGLPCNPSGVDVLEMFRDRILIHKFLSLVRVNRLSGRVFGQSSPPSLLFGVCRWQALNGVGGSAWMGQGDPVPVGLTG